MARSTRHTVLHFEDILPKTGWGLYYRFMLGMTCASCFTNAAAFLSLPLSIPMSACENTAISEDILYGIHTSFAVGRCIGGFLVNSFSDVCGRKRFLTYSLLTIFVTTFASAFAYNYYMIMISAFFLACGLECNSTVVKIHLCEILPKKRRGFFLSVCDICWTLGYLMVSAFAVLMENPTYVEHRAVDMRLSTWRMILALTGGFSLLLACSSALLEESPRYFMHMNNNYLAILTLKQFYAINKSSYGNSFDARESDLNNLVQDYGLSLRQRSDGEIDLAGSSVKIMCKSLKLLLSKHFRKTTILLLILKTPLLILTIFNVNVLVAKMFNNPVKDGLDLIYLKPAGNMTSCFNDDDYKVLYPHYFILALNILLGQIIMMWTLDRFGRKPLLILAMMFIGGSYIVLHYLKNNTMRLISSSIILLSSSAALTVTSLMNIELFPTAVRGTSQGLTNIFGIVLSILVVRFYHLLMGWFLLIIGYVFLATTVVPLFLKDLKRQPMIE